MINYFNSVDTTDKNIYYYSRPVFDNLKQFAIVQWDNGHSGLGGGGGMFNKKKDVGSNVEVSCNIQKSGNDTYIISPATKLAAGEYGFLNMMLMTANGRRPLYTVFAFGIDQ